MSVDRESKGFLTNPATLITHLHRSTTELNHQSFQSSTNLPRKGLIDAVEHALRSIDTPPARAWMKMKSTASGVNVRPVRSMPRILHPIVRRL